jgi:prepilin-type N-terminal cleavage/methylation domain-containing protein
MSLYRKKGSRAFSLVEMLIVVAIISILASVIIVSISKSRARGRDAKRTSDLKQIELALTYYYDSANTISGVRAYPSTGGAWYSSEPSDTVSNNGGNWIPGLAPNFIDTLPRNPGGAKINHANCNGAGVKASYRYRSDGVSYKLLAFCSPESTWTSTHPFYDPVRTDHAWMICAGTTACSTW